MTSILTANTFMRIYEHQARNVHDADWLMDLPQFEHDCDSCTFLGNAFATNNRPVDLYVHRDPKMPTIIMRYGDEGEQYTSGLDFVENSSAMALAWYRFEAMVLGGLL